MVRIHVVSSESSNYDRIIVPQEDAGDIPTITLGYYPEGQGELIDFLLRVIKKIKMILKKSSNYDITMINNRVYNS